MLEIILEIIYWYFLGAILSILWGFFWGDKLYWWRRKKKLSKILDRILITNKKFKESESKWVSYNNAIWKRNMQNYIEKEFKKKGKNEKK